MSASDASTIELLSPRDRLMQLLTEKRAALSASAASYDAGSLWEAKRLANEIAILVHDPLRGKTRSLLTQIGVKSGLLFVDSTARHPLRGARNAVPPSALLGFRGDDGGWSVVASCQSGLVPPEWIDEVKFKLWWDGEVVRFKTGNLSRKNLVMSARDQDGGAHVDVVVQSQGYTALGQDVDVSVRTAGAPLQNAHLACIRQISWELIETLDRALASPAKRS